MWIVVNVCQERHWLPELDGGASIWQLNWVQVNEPSQGQTIKNQYNTLWIQLTFRDDTGTIMLYITESAVVKLANCVDAAEFEQLHAEGRLRMPFFGSIKVYRRPSKPSAVQPLGIHSKPAQSEQSELSPPHTPQISMVELPPHTPAQSVQQSLV